MTLRVLDLFSGIGGFSLGLERTRGFRTVAFCEIEPYCRAVLAKHWPGVPIYDDVRTLTADALSRDGIAVDVICGGFPCQDLSFAGKRAGLEGARSGLWSEYARLIGELRPRYVIVENVPGLLSLGMGDVLGSLAALGYDATWDCIPASAVGAPHRRDRVWLVAYAAGERPREARQLQPIRSEDRPTGRGSPPPHAHGQGQGQHDGPVHAEVEGAQEPVADAQGVGPSELAKSWPHNSKASQSRQAIGGGSCETMAHADSGHEHGRGRHVQVGGQRREGETPHHGHPAGVEWEFEPDVGRVADGVPARVDRLRALGNAVVPQIPEIIGRAILEAEGLAA